MATRVTGLDAIVLAEKNGWLLSVRGEDGEETRDGVALDEARRIAQTRPDRVYVEFDELPPGDTGIA